MGSLTSKGVDVDPARARVGVGKTTGVARASGGNGVPLAASDGWPTLVGNVGLPGAGRHAASIAASASSHPRA